MQNFQRQAIFQWKRKRGRIFYRHIRIMAGSIPSSMPDDMYEKIMARLDGKGVMIVVDATRDLLVNVLKYHPFLVKPNNH